MYHDSNKHLNNKKCEFCGEQFYMFEKIIFPSNCVNNEMEQEIAPDASVEHFDNDYNKTKQKRLDKHGLPIEWDRSHYYHVICQDLIKEKLNLRESAAKDYCLTCDLDKEKREEREARQEHYRKKWQKRINEEQEQRPDYFKTSPLVKRFMSKQPEIKPQDDLIKNSIENDSNWNYSQKRGPLPIIDINKGRRRRQNNKNK